MNSIIKDLSVFHVNNKDSNETEWMARLIRVLVGYEWHIVGVVIMQIIVIQ